MILVLAEAKFKLELQSMNHPTTMYPKCIHNIRIPKAPLICPECIPNTSPMGLQCVPNTSPMGLQCVPNASPMRPQCIQNASTMTRTNKKWNLETLTLGSLSIQIFQNFLPSIQRLLWSVLVQFLLSFGSGLAQFLHSFD